MLKFKIVTSSPVLRYIKLVAYTMNIYATVWNQVDALTSSCTKALSYKQIAFMIITKLLRNVNFGKNGYPQKWQNVIFDDKNMFSI